MVRNRKSQAAFEYLTTYGWALMTGLVAIGALAYFGFLNPTNLLPNKCDFGSQLQCTDYEIQSNGDVNIMLRNNFGKDINITGVAGIEMLILNPNTPLNIPAGTKRELSMNLDSPYRKSAGDKQEVSMILTFVRASGGNNHNISGTVFVTVKN